MQPQHAKNNVTQLQGGTYTANIYATSEFCKKMLQRGIAAWILASNDGVSATYLEEIRFIEENPFGQFTQNSVDNFGRTHLYHFINYLLKL